MAAVSRRVTSVDLPMDDVVADGADGGAVMMRLRAGLPTDQTNRLTERHAKLKACQTNEHCKTFAGK